MKFKRRIAAVCSSILVFGFSFLLFPQTTTETVTKNPPTVTSAPTATPVPVFPTGDTETISPTPPSVLTQKPDNYVHVLLDDTNIKAPMAAISDLVTAYITAYYSNDYETVSSLVTDPSFLNPTVMEEEAGNIKNVENIELYAKPGIDGIFSIVYASFSLYYKDIQISVPQFTEYYIKRLSDGTYRIQTVPLSKSTSDILMQARSTEGIQKLAIASLIRRYHVACLMINEPLLKQCVTDSDYLNINYLSSRYSVTETITDYDFLLYPGVNEFDYIVFVTHKEKIVFSDTPAPCMEYYYIDLDDTTGVPRIYLGITSLDTDAYCAAVIQNDEIQELAKQINLDMQNALLADDDLKDFYQLLLSNTENQ